MPGMPFGAFRATIINEIFSHLVKKRKNFFLTFLRNIKKAAVGAALKEIYYYALPDIHIGMRRMRISWISGRD